MKHSKGLLVIGFLMFLILVEVSVSQAQERKIFEGKVIGMRMKLWLDVESQQDKAVMNFRIGRRTVYTPHRYPKLGEAVKVEYQLQRGIPIAFTVTRVEGLKDVQKEGTKEDSPESPKESEKPGPK